MARRATGRRSHGGDRRAITGVTKKRLAQTQSHAALLFGSLFSLSVLDVVADACTSNNRLVVVWREKSTACGVFFVVIVVVGLSVDLRCWRLGFRFVEFERPEHVPEHGTEEDDARDDQQRSLPLVGRDQVVRERSEDDRAEARTAHSNARRERSQLFEVHRDTDDGRQVDHAEPKARSEADCDVQREDIFGENAENQAD